MNRRLLLLLTLAGCATAQAAPDAGARDRDTAVLAAVVQHLVLEEHPPGEKPACLGIEGMDEQQTLLLGKTAVAGRTFHPGNECRLDPAGVGAITHQPSGREAILYHVHAWVWQDERTALVYAGWAGASLYGASCRYRVERVDGRWKVTAADECVVS